MTVIESIRAKLRKNINPAPPTHDSRLFTIHGGWGHHCEWKDWDTRQVWGHLPEKPKVGDYLESKLKGGKALFRFCDVEYMRDPPDMFFATVEDLGYDRDVDREVYGIPAAETKSMFL